MDGDRTAHVAMEMAEQFELYMLDGDRYVPLSSAGWLAIARVAIFAADEAVTCGR